MLHSAVSCSPHVTRRQRPRHLPPPGCSGPHFFEGWVRRIMGDAIGRIVTLLGVRARFHPREWMGRFPFNFSGVEQLVACRVHNPKVVGSSPTPATTFACRLSSTGRAPLCKRDDRGSSPRSGSIFRGRSIAGSMHLPVTEEIVGSNPTVPAIRLRV